VIVLAPEPNPGRACPAGGTERHPWYARRALSSGQFAGTHRAKHGDMRHALLASCLLLPFVVACSLSHERGDDGGSPDGALGDAGRDSGPIACGDGACTDGGGPRICGTIAGLTCGDGQYCDWGGDCGPDRGGICRAAPRGCPALVDPVCGCDGVTHTNPCEAVLSGIGIASSGPCPMPRPPADCRSSGCPSGTSCGRCWTSYVCLPDGAIC